MKRKTTARFAPKIVEPVFFALAAVSVLCAALIVIRALRVDAVQFRFLLWNLFLAWLPLLVSMAALAWSRSVRGAPLAIGLSLLGVAWLLLYPNAPYLTTDFIHLIFDTFYIGYDKEGLLLWYDLVLFFLFSWCGLLLGYLSMRHFHAIVHRFLGTLAGWAFIVTVSFLGGFGVYLGRVVRLNSWDALFSPFRLIEGVLAGIHAQAAGFALLFGTLILIVYVSLFLGWNPGGSSAPSTSGDGP
ncbi:DUF1361 domain-containing protein [Cohnella hongkongensis]|uniref:DUF1361 domain-containing protein n=1 Tax=Cohnella hongkongensis TaxID=178337 RepID=A0ABV9FEQ5_9BACL